jgi:hypothetical protein
MLYLSIITLEVEGESIKKVWERDIMKICIILPEKTEK